MEILEAKEFENILFSIGNQIIKVSSDNSEKSDGLLNSENEYVLAIKADKVNISNMRESEEEKELDSNTYLGTIKETYFLGKWGQLMVSVPGFSKLIAVLISSKNMSEFKIQTKARISISAKDISFFKESWTRIKQLEED